MLKLVLCLICGTATAVVVLELREQHLNLSFQTDRLHNQIEASQAKLWNQQLSIAVATAPNALAAEARGQDLKFTDGKGPPGRSWVDDPDSK
jgi:hypothetical protein